MFSGGGVEAAGTGSARPGCIRKTACIKIIEQPASKALRFRYECEGRSAGSIPGVNSTPEKKTFPSIRIEGYTGRAVVVVSCVTKDKPYRPHPHNLVGKEACKRGVCTVEIASGSRTVTFANLGIQCVKKKDIAEALKVREEIRVDPYRTGFSHRMQTTSIDLNAVRLCFQVFLEGTEKGKFTVPLAPVVSEPIYDKKAMSDLVICRISACCCTVAGGKEMILLCEKIAKEDIQVRFFEERDGHLVWEGFGDFQPTHVHKQVAISFRVPQYRVLQVDQPVKVLIQLRRPSDGVTSDPVPFQFLPLDSDPESKRKRKCADDHSSDQVLRHLQGEADKHEALKYQCLGDSSNPVKVEPAESCPLPYQRAYRSDIRAGGFSPLYRADPSRGTPSPHSSLTSQSHEQKLPGRTPSPMGQAAPACVPRYNVSPFSRRLDTQQHQQLPQEQHHRQLNASFQFHSIQQHQYTLHQQMMQYRVNVEQPEPDFLSHVTPGSRNLVTENTEGIPSVTSTLNQDNPECGIERSSLKQLDSSDLATLSMFDDNLSQNLSDSLSLSDNRISRVETARTTGIEAAGIGMTDSLTRLTTNTIQELCTLNNMYKPTRDHID